MIFQRMEGLKNITNMHWRPLDRSTIAPGSTKHHLFIKPPVTCVECMSTCLSGMFDQELLPLACVSRICQFIYNIRLHFNESLIRVQHPITSELPLCEKDMYALSLYIRIHILIYLFIYTRVSLFTQVHLHVSIKKYVNAHLKEYQAVLFLFVYQTDNNVLDQRKHFR